MWRWQRAFVVGVFPKGSAEGIICDGLWLALVSVAISDLSRYGRARIPEDDYTTKGMNIFVRCM